MNKQSTWRSTLIEAFGAQLMILAVAAALSLLHGTPARAEAVGASPLEGTVTAALAVPRRVPEASEGAGSPPSEPRSEKNFVTCFQVDMEFLDRFERTRRKFFLNP